MSVITEVIAVEFMSVDVTVDICPRNHSLGLEVIRRSVFACFGPHHAGEVTFYRGDIEYLQRAGERLYSQYPVKDFDSLILARARKLKREPADEGVKASESATPDLPEKVL